MPGNIFVVDDDPSVLGLLQASLQSKGYTVKGFTSGHEAIHFLKQGSNADQFQLYIIDRMLPDMDGTDILSSIRNDLKKTTPAIILSSLSAEKDVLGGLQKGATDYVTKPFNIEILMQKVDSMIR